MMTPFQFHKAQPVVDPVESVTIIIDAEIPNFGSLADAAGQYRTEGEMLADVLLEALPGGTLDGLIAALLKRRASLFLIPFGKGE